MPPGKLQNPIIALQKAWIPFIVYDAAPIDESAVHITRWNPDANLFECWGTNTRRWLQRAQGRPITMSQATTLLQGATFQDLT